MSISLGHRAIFTAFRHRSSFISKAAAPASVSEIEAAAVLEAGQLRCSPWEGLYLEQAHPVAAAQDAATGRDLDAFLVSLMYGE